MSEVFLYSVEDGSFSFSDFKSSVSPFLRDTFDGVGDLAFKLHFGERESDTHLDPMLVECLYRDVAGYLDDVVLMDCNVLYNSDRSFAESHREVAVDNGFGFAPIVIADGEDGGDEVEVKVGLKHFDVARIGSAIDGYGGVLSIAHFTGHDATGVGGCLKNIGMGLGSKSGKLEMHKAFKLTVDGDCCVGCSRCLEVCPSGGIDVCSVAEIDHGVCIGCGRCVGACPEGAVEIPWGASSSKDLQERIVEYAYAVLRDRDSFHINVVMDVTSMCDCVNEKQEPVIDDIGILFSGDPVAVDQASIDLAGTDFVPEGVDPGFQTRYAEEIGLGSTDYNIKEV
ncbi:DUF362 domain-containing protein [Methanonatronarchaeum sp. AMET6-2]|uniref:DUF362 domain-containing protein n=1 Tax=Methanonatronarchaeum sp. AMET6-2 TaxID=2933293 RepID=UPI001FF2840E|nr:DUF362 domain-containing protein [Methanonatronarchaeum sp. AMET6-2]UOY09421.1 DUF362 domain-containing protein [Methanonatronarchaeum sp. AMET6-2]